MMTACFGVIFFCLFVVVFFTVRKWKDLCLEKKIYTKQTSKINYVIPTWIIPTVKSTEDLC